MQCGTHVKKVTCSEENLPALTAMVVVSSRGDGLARKGDRFHEVDETGRVGSTDGNTAETSLSNTVSRRSRAVGARRIIEPRNWRADDELHLASATLERHVEDNGSHVELQ